MRPFSLLIKPTSADCNLACQYCFYLEKRELYTGTLHHRMDIPTLEKMTASYLSLPLRNFSFAWQGGEPTLMGVDFFREALRLQKKYGSNNSQIQNSIQTNGLLLTDEFVRFLTRADFLVGVSIDGPKDLHDKYRTSSKGSGSYDQVMHNVKKLRNQGTSYNILALVNQDVAERARDVYRHHCEQGFPFQQYIECVEMDRQGNPQPYSVSAEAWGKFLCTLFDEWYPNDTQKISIRLFDSILNKMVAQRDTSCTFCDDCRQYLVVEHNGDIYPCDFFVRKDEKLGNILSVTWESLTNSSKYADFGTRKLQHDPSCAKCEAYLFCKGGCLKNRGTEIHGKDLLCDGWRRFYSYTKTRFGILADRIRKSR